MEKNLRRSERSVKITRDSTFIYDDEVIEALTDSVNIQSKSWQHCPDSDSNCVKTAKDCNSVNLVNNASVNKVSDWSNVYPNVSSNEKTSVIPLLLGSVTRLRSESIEFQEKLLASRGASAAAAAHEKVNIESAGSRRISSTTESFLDIEGNFLSDSVAEMGRSSSESDNVGKNRATSNLWGGAGFSGTKASTPQSPADEGDGVAAAIMLVLKDVRALSAKIDTFGIRLDNLEEAKSSQESGVESSNRLSSQGAKKIPKQVPEKSKKKTKKDRVEFEKNRTHKVVEEKLEERNKKKETSESEEVSSEEEQDLSGVKKKMSKKQRDAARRKTAAVLESSGSSFPEEEDETSNISGTESEEVRVSKKKKKVKSGAKVRCRPVVKTELWPHTIAIEDDGDDVTSENIGLAKFLSCFTYIMTTCEKSKKGEAAGRALLLHAVCTVLECLPWAEARTFHNLVMTKLEQGRISWKFDFSELAGQFLEKKVRQSLLIKNQAASGPSSSRNGYRSLGKGFGHFSNRNNFGYGRNNSTYYNVCKKWNEGSCPFGDRCRRRHVCWTCYETGKTGELHKSSSHGSAGGQNDRSQQQRQTS